MRVALVLCSALLVVSCASSKPIPRTSFVVLRDVPEAPSVTIMPINFSDEQVEGAEKLEEILLSFKVRVINPPSLKEIITKEGWTVEQNDARKLDGSATRAGGNVTNRFYSYNDYSSDYVMFTNVKERRIKIMKVASGEILSSFTYERSKAYAFKEGYLEYEQYFADTIYDNLFSLGIIKEIKNN